MGRSEPFTASSLTTLGRGLDPAAVTAFVESIESRLVRVEVKAIVIGAHADAADLRRRAQEETSRIRIKAYAEIAAIHERAMAEVERLEAGCHRLNRLLDSVETARAARTEAGDGIHIVVEPDIEAALDPASRS